MRKIVTGLAQLATFGFIAFALVILATSKFQNPWGIKSFVVLTGSMRPTISQGSVIFTQENSQYKKGDVIAFRKNNITVTHRIVESNLMNNGVTYETKGDANKAADDTAVTYKDVLGKQVATVPFIGNFILFMRSLPGFVLLIILPALLYTTYEINNIKLELEGRTRFKRSRKKYTYEVSIPHLKIDVI